VEIEERFESEPGNPSLSSLPGSPVPRPNATDEPTSPTSEVVLS
jgi:hypothetical protein